MSKNPKRRTREEADIYLKLGIDSALWDVDINFTKGALSGNRGVIVTVTNIRTGMAKKSSMVAKTKRG